MLAVLISISPEWIEKIHRGEKIWELRKTLPKPADHQFIKVYNYETKANGGRGKIVSEWVLKDYLTYFDDIATKDQRAEVCKNACVTEKQLAEYYQKGREVIYCWNINDLKIYDQPKELSEFQKVLDCDDYPCNKGRYCDYEYYDSSEGCWACGIDFDGNHCIYKQLTRAPQSWCYVEELEEQR